ncbi:MAG TPA: magnesium chelatase domain-containing protein, partial [Mycobacteriales bacterium]|nr:magnesium chelatase domain-containing protein [Mycobacteriales bacterium]
AKSRGLATVVVGHVTKDGAVAGPRLLEHLVDVVLHFEGDRHSALRMVRAVKNRFGPADEVGCFTLTDAGIVGIADPSGLFVGERRDPVPGTCATVVVEGRRPLPAEVQALVAPVPERQSPRRAVSGLDGGRVSMVLAVLEKRAGAPLSSRDVYLATVGGARLTEPATDLAVALAVASAFTEKALPADLVAVGELGLSGELRPVPGVSRRLAEAARLGFRTALVPAGSGGAGAAPAGMTVHEVSGIEDAYERVAALQVRPRRRPDGPARRSPFPPPAAGRRRLPEGTGRPRLVLAEPPP